MENVKRIPYGISNFTQVRNENLYYSDKTMFLEKMENAGHFLFIVRPRRFGKSIFVSMMRAYYDINEKDNFDKYFSGLYVHEHPTKEMGPIPGIVPRLLTSGRQQQDRTGKF